jgi:hypothetical protein
MCGSTPDHTRSVAAKATITDHQSTESFFMQFSYDLASVLSTNQIDNT